MYRDDNNNSINCTNNQSKWQITLTSKNCIIRKHLEGWQIRPKSENDEERNLELTLTVPKLDVKSQDVAEGKIKTANAEIYCNRDDLEELLGTENAENDRENGNIILEEYLKLVTNEKVKINILLKILTKAVNEHKIYTIYGTFPPLKKPLADRGWVEKRAIRRMKEIAATSDLCEDGWEQIGKLLQTPADLVWYTSKKPFIRVDDKTIVNRFAGSYFTSKVNMCNNLENAHWFYEAGVSNVQFPRCYNIYQSAQVKEFVQDYYITACFGMLKWFLLLANLVGARNTWSPNGTIPINAITFASERCVQYLSVQMHEDIDRKDTENASPSAWHQFLDWFYEIIYERVLLKESDQVNINALVTHVRDIVRTMLKYRPQSKIDGIRNIWILKPGDNSLGRGIVLKSYLVDILTKINQTVKESTQYVIQKYIERPLLVHKTKMDIRQWFLLTSTQPLVVWIYKDILIRFASRDFTLSDFHESIHLCNTTVQLKYRKLPRCNSDLPEQLHWDLQHFKDYLQSRDQGLAWERVIRPGIKQNLIGALLASQDNMVNRKNSFQLYGADFVVADDFSVWLLEINTNPRLHPPSSEVTARLYPEVIEDAMKVILDRRKDKKAPHGRFECIYRQRNPFCGVNILGQGAALGIRGKNLFATPKSPRDS